jgi:uncharacterized protein
VKNGFRIFDTHTHLGEARHSGRVQRVDEMLRHMEATGVDRSLLIPFPVVSDYRATHDEIASAMRVNPDRFVSAVCLDVHVPEREYLDEMRRCREQLGFQAWKLQPQYQAFNPLSKRYDALFAEAVRLGLVLVVHTGAGAPFALPSLWIAVARRFPELRIVLGHAGGGLYVGEAIVAAMVCPNIFIELSSLMPHHVREVLAHVPPSRLMAGSDLPESVEIEIGKILGLDTPDEVKRQILWKTPRLLFDAISDEAP